MKRIRYCSILLILFTAILPAAPPDLALTEVAGNEYLRLYIDAETTELIVRDPRGGEWRTNPIGREDDRIASSVNLARLNSQVVVSLYTPRDQMVLFTSWEHSVEKGQFEIREIPDGVEVTYHMDNHVRDETDIPVAVFADRFENRFLAHMTAEEQELFLSRYTYESEQGLYYRFGIPRFLLEDFFAVLDRIGYSRMELKQDAEASRLFQEEQEEALKERIPGLRLTDNSRNDEISLSLTIRYILDGKSLVVSIPPESVESDPAYPIHTILPLEFFGAAGASREGFIFVPDGSGALIRLNNGKYRFPAFSMPVFGSRRLDVVKEEVATHKDIQMPVFGLSSDESSFFAIIESAAAAAGIQADVAGRLSTFNHVNAEFRFREKGKITIGTGEKARSKLIFEEAGRQEPMRIRYHLLEASSGYTRMAGIYREDLIRRGLLAPKAPPASPQFQLELIGAVENRRRFLGISMPETIELTTFSEAISISEALIGRGVESIALRLKGWSSGGIAHDYPRRLRPAGELGGRSGLRELQSYTAGNGITLIPEVDVLRIYNTGNGFTPRRDAARYLNQASMRGYSYDPATFQREIDGLGWYYLTPQRFGPLGDEIGAWAGEMGFEHLHLSDLAAEAYGDYDNSDPVSTAEMMANGAQLLENLNADFTVGTDGFMTPYLGNTAYIHDLPLDDSDLNITDTEIPFNALVLHGLVPYSGEAINLAADERRAFLKSIESGAIPAFCWTFAETALFKETAFDGYYSTTYDSWIDSAADYYHQFREVHDPLSGRNIIDHAILAPGIVRVRYEDGTDIWLNYTQESTTHAGVFIPAESYVVNKESAL